MSDVTWEGRCKLKRKRTRTTGNDKVTCSQEVVGKSCALLHLYQSKSIQRCLYGGVGLLEFPHKLYELFYLLDCDGIVNACANACGSQRT